MRFFRNPVLESLRISCICLLKNPKRGPSIPLPQFDLCLNYTHFFQVKKWAEHHRLVGSYEHRLSGSGLALLVIFFLQRAGVVPVLQEVYPTKFGTLQPIIGKLSYDFSRQVKTVHVVTLSKSKVLNSK